MSLLKTYRATLKKTTSEEIIDLLVFRPLGFLLAYSLKRTPISPNQVTALSMLCGIASGITFYFHSYALGALFLFLANALDCADGQLARLKKASSKIGRALDGFGDYVVYVAVYLGMTLAFMRDTGNSYFFWWGAVTGLATMIQAAFFDEYRNRYSDSSTPAELQAEIEEFEEYRRTNKNYFNLFMTWFYVLYSKKQLKMRIKKPDLKVSDLFIRLLSFVGSTTHISFLIVCALTRRIDYYYYGVSLVLSGYMALLFLFQKWLNKVKE